MLIQIGIFQRQTQKWKLFPPSSHGLNFKLKVSLRTTGEYYFKNFVPHIYCHLGHACFIFFIRWKIIIVKLFLSEIPQFDQINKIKISNSHWTFSNDHQACCERLTKCYSILENRTGILLNKVLVNQRLFVMKMTQFPC